MVNKIKRSPDFESKGFWFTTKTGQHIYVGEDESPKEACKRVYKEKEQNTAPTVSHSDLERLYGEEFKGFKNRDAIDKLFKEQRGHIKAAFHRNDIGDIDLLWGDDYVGLQHIIKQRMKEKPNATAEEHAIRLNLLFSKLSNAVENGVLKKRSTRGDYNFVFDHTMVIVAPEYHGEKATYVLTAFKKK